MHTLRACISPCAGDNTACTDACENLPTMASKTLTEPRSERGKAEVPLLIAPPQADCPQPETASSLSNNAEARKRN